MLRAAAKNHADVTVVVDPADYGPVLEALRAGGVSPAMRRELARKVFHHTSRYDGMIAGYLEQQGAPGLVRFPSLLTLQFEKVQSLRYGENPHQHGAFYRDFGSSEPGVAKARQLHGKEMSYNNFLDAYAALELAKEYGVAPHPARVVVLDDDRYGKGRDSIFLGEFQRGIGVEEVVVGHLLAVELPRLRHARLAAPEIAVEGSMLVRVLAVAEALHLLELQGEEGREPHQTRRALLLEIAGNHAVVPRGVVKDLAGQFPAHRRRHAASAQRFQHGPVIRRVHYDRHVRVVFGSRAQHGRPADVAGLDRLVERAARLVDRRFEGIEVDHHHVDRPDPVALHLGDMLGVAAAAQQPPVDLGMERLDPPVQNLGRAGIGGHVGDRDPGISERLGGPASGENLVPQLLQPLGEFEDPGLVRHADQRPFHARSSLLYIMWLGDSSLRSE